jgi:hypothetical protein
MILTQKEIDHIRMMYQHMNEFALKKTVENLLETADLSRAEADRWKRLYHLKGELS